MKTRHTLIAAAAFATLLGGLMVPALAETSGGSQTMPGRDMGTGRMGHGMSDGMMSGDMSGCMSMMRSMNNGDGRPNSQWQKHPPGDRPMPN
jgi:hypothetical protein